MSFVVYELIIARISDRASSGVAVCVVSHACSIVIEVDLQLLLTLLLFPLGMP